MQSNQVRPSGPTRTVDLSAYTRAIKSDHPRPTQWICQPIQSSQADHRDQPGKWISQPIQEQSSQIILNQHSGFVSPYRAVKQTIGTNQDSGFVSLYRAVKQTIRTNKDSGLDSGSVSPYRAVKSDRQDQVGQWICDQPTQSSRDRPSRPTRIVNLSGHTEQSSRIMKTTQEGGSVYTAVTTNWDHGSQVWKPVKSGTAYTCTRILHLTVANGW